MTGQMGVMMAAVTTPAALDLGVVRMELRGMLIFKSVSHYLTLYHRHIADLELYGMRNNSTALSPTRPM